MPEHRSPRRSKLTGVGDDWKKVRGGQTKMWHQSLKSLTPSLSRVMPNHRLPRRAMFYGVGVGWKKARSGQTKTWQKSMKSLTSGLRNVGRCRLPGWGPPDDSKRWLETLDEMTENRLPWRRCIHSLCSPKF
ncbi:unnamed protein product [Schistosoma mattheei]|uniref:Uncharacterized protein n=1 Tax=Schistosoma mattheei TaxID=31246 RepID=A0A183PRB5_9TREM|nr:unnamed protein product [Schistosoma mattheei]